MKYSIVYSILATVIILTPYPASAESDEPVRTISVQGVGSVSAKPDMASINAGVVTRARKPTTALSENTKAVNKLFQVLKRFGIEDKDMRTSNFNVSPIYDRRRNIPEPRPILEYQVSNQLTIRVRDLAKLGDLLDQLVASGGNRLNGISFSVSEPKNLLDQARKLAVIEAKRRAHLYAKELDIEVGPVISISEGSIAPPRPRFMARMEMKSAAVPIATGEQTITASVSVVFEID